jgi:hypothetical protein
MRYQPENIKDSKLNWQVVDYELREALDRYNAIKTDRDEKGKK